VLPPQQPSRIVALHEWHGTARPPSGVGTLHAVVCAGARTRVRYCLRAQAKALPTWWPAATSLLFSPSAVCSRTHTHAHTSTHCHFPSFRSPPPGWCPVTKLLAPASLTPHAWPGFGAGAQDRVRAGGWVGGQEPDGQLQEPGGLVVTHLPHLYLPDTIWSVQCASHCHAMPAPWPCPVCQAWPDGRHTRPSALGYLTHQKSHLQSAGPARTFRTGPVGAGP